MQVMSAFTYFQASLPLCLCLWHKLSPLFGNTRFTLSQKADLRGCSLKWLVIVLFVLLPPGKQSDSISSTESGFFDCFRPKMKSAQLATRSLRWSGDKKLAFGLSLRLPLFNANTNGAEVGKFGSLRFLPQKTLIEQTKFLYLADRNLLIGFLE